MRTRTIHPAVFILAGALVGSSAARAAQPCLAEHYHASEFCPASSLTLPNSIGFTDDGLAANDPCGGQRVFRLVTGRLVNATGPLQLLRRNCTLAQFGDSICGPDSVLIDIHARWPIVPSPVPNLVIAGGACNIIYFMNPTSGGVIETFDDPAFGSIGQMAIDSTGRLFVGTVGGDSLNVISMGAVEPFYTAPGQSLQAVTLDAAENVYVTGATDGVMRELAPSGAIINAQFAASLHGAVAQTIAPPGIFHGNLFVACTDRVMEVNLATGESSVFVACQSANGIAFDPEGYMYISQSSDNQILKIRSALSGDTNGDGQVNTADAPGFIRALLKTPDAPLPILTADMNADACADGADVQPFIDAIIPH